MRRFSRRCIAVKTPATAIEQPGDRTVIALLPTIITDPFVICGLLWLNGAAAGLIAARIIGGRS